MPLEGTDLASGGSILVVSMNLGGIYGVPAWDQADALSALYAPPDFTILTLTGVTADVEIVSNISQSSLISSGGLADNATIVSNIATSFAVQEP